ncbi:acyl-CoA dehydrogenase-like protein [Eremomyces bilateralis CBS 781.70]|uniref:Acyl-CoA dehydrogenase-like protein n=1 Tax=Eremomyces bilateralis CBS 781.70 TaxID=1392243 RepID=A0A6G1G683_9PEZI|nr:acyl-CoA dehydrogenase-like protein [Eremomyces bilateralis CBS 781.70]KAF1813436.1 acyl-CoA dehydrogenase-like protein [Eremomyces bilateralis CBS 781.70]
MRSNPYGSQLPWAEPPWYQGRPSPYYKPTHIQLRDAVRKWCEDNVMDQSDQWEEDGKIPDEIYRKCGEDGLLMPIAAGKKIPKEWAHYPIIGGIKPEDWDGFHDFILWDELLRGGAISSIFIGLTVGAPPLRQFASKELQSEFMPAVLKGEKRICLAITEPSAGSDVRNISTTAEKTADGKHYIVNGEKKWITNGMYSDYFMTAVRTGGPGAEGISMLLIPRMEGIRTRPVSIGAGKLSATTFVTFEDVKVPARYLVGEEGKGFRYTLSNFNHERLWIVFQGLRGSRTCIEDAMAWAMKREAFGMTLIEQPVVRHKFGQMARQIDSLQSWTEQVIYELDQLSDAEGSRLLGGVTALLKVQGGIVGKFVADECVKLMGGLGLTTTGQGARIEATYRSIPSLIVPGGSEDVMIDLGVREALKLSQKAIGKAKI